jgi:hypothetical protein
VATAFLVEESVEGRSLIVTGPWSAEAESLVREGVVDGLVLNYARGFAEPNLDFLGGWPIRRLDLLDRKVTDLGPIARLGDTLEDFSVQVAASAEVDLAGVPRLTKLGAWWDAVKATLHQLDRLEELVVMDYEETDLRPLAVQQSLTSVRVKVAPLLETLDGAEDLPSLSNVGVVAARELRDIGALVAVTGSLVEVKFESCLDIDQLDDLGQLDGLRFLGVSDCGRVESLRPLEGLVSLETLYMWGSTRILDNDLSPLLRLTRLGEIRMRDRADYRPRLADIKTSLGITT